LKEAVAVICSVPAWVGFGGKGGEGVEADDAVFLCGRTGHLERNACSRLRFVKG